MCFILYAAASLTGNSAFLQQPTFVPGPGQHSAAGLAPQASTAGTMGGYPQEPMHAPMYGPFSQQQYAQYQQHPQLYDQHQQQQQLQLLQQQQHQQHQQALQYQPVPTSQHLLQQQAHQMSLSQASSAGSLRSAQQFPSSGSQRGSPRASSVTDFGLTANDSAQCSQLAAVASQGVLQEAGQQQQAMGAGQALALGSGKPMGSQMPGGNQAVNVASVSQVPNQIHGGDQDASTTHILQAAQMQGGGLALNSTDMTQLSDQAQGSAQKLSASAGGVEASSQAL